MIDKNCFMPLNYFKKTNYMGSMTGLRFRLGKAVIPYTEEEIAELTAKGKEVNEGDGITVLRATIWEGPFSYEKRDQEKSYYQDFAFSNSGIDEAVEWLNQEYLNDKERWDDVMFWTPQMSREWNQ